MPELPDVEAFRLVVADHAVGRPVRSVEVTDTGVLRGVSAARLRDHVSGCRLRSPWRHGKWLVVPIASGAAMLMHFGMTGSLLWAADGDGRQAHDRVVFGFDDGELRYRDQRKLKGIRFAADESEVERELAALGPDAAEVSSADLRQPPADNEQAQRQVRPDRPGGRRRARKSARRRDPVASQDQPPSFVR